MLIFGLQGVHALPRSHARVTIQDERVSLIFVPIVLILAFDARDESADTSISNFAAPAFGPAIHAPFVLILVIPDMRS